ncbi:glycosyltransferase family 39 protein [Streptacidiphilus neutrinimicus]|uniref:glycosyltransferase family 39 protein n=1 Tax=Streptacidiphilus neutrinimicus TaxID=105420 RepID=UPI000693958E|nr:glycosyltransferase family 39 protein [Streptacidiphilus neutrinimicus]
MTGTHPWEHEVKDGLPAEPADQPTPGQRAGQSAGTARLTARHWLPPVLLMLGMGLYGIGGRQPWEDEYASWWAASLSWSDLGRLLSHVDIVLAPYYAAMHLWIGAFGDSPTAMRLPSVLAMATAAGLLVPLGRRLFDARVGLAAGLLFAVIPMTSRYAQEARPYAFAVLAAVAATLLLYRAIDQPCLGRWTGYAALVTAMGLAHLVTLTVLAAHFVALLIERSPGGRPRLLPWAASVAAGILPVLPLIWFGHAQSQQIAWLEQTNMTLAALPGQLFRSTPAGWTVIAIGLLGVLLVRARTTVVLCWAALPPLVLYATRSTLDLFLNRYLIFTLPAWALLAGAAVCVLIRKLPGTAPWREPLAAAAAALALALVTLGAFAAVRANPLPGEPDWQRAATWTMRQSRPGDGVAINGYREGVLALSYQMWRNPAAPHDVFAGRSAQSLGTFDPATCQVPAVCAQPYLRIWLFSTAPKGHSFDQMPASVRDLLATHYRVKEAKEFASLRVLLLIPRSA